MTTSPESRPGEEPRHGFRLRVVFVLLCLAIICAGFTALGYWQSQRLGWKLELIQRVDQRIHQAPVAPPGPALWSQVNRVSQGYRRVRVQGRFLYQDEVLVHTSTQYGYGYWLLTPMQTRAGYCLFINRGFVPSDLPHQPAYTELPRPQGTTTVVGLLRMNEPGGGVMRNNRPQAGQWYSRDVQAMARHLQLRNCAPYFVDAQALPNAPKWPAAGLTKTHFRNAHLSYAITWYILALGTLLGSGIVLRYEWRRGQRRAK